jgi:membrane protease YdiL (CAAX protease family)
VVGAQADDAAPIARPSCQASGSDEAPDPETSGDTVNTEAPPRPAARPGPVHAFVRRHPVGVFLTVAIGLTWAIQWAFLIAGQDLTPALLAELVILLGTSVWVTGVADGRAGVRRLFAGLVRWRIGIGRAAVLLLAMPVLTLLVAAATGTLERPAAGWPGIVGSYFFMALVYGALTANLWEETAWAGFTQSRLMSRHGLLVGSLLTAIPFFLIHIPLAFADKGLAGTPLREALFIWLLQALTAPFLRYLIGTVLVDTGGSTLAAGVLHGAFNAAGAMAVLQVGWQYVPALVLLTLLVTGYRTWRGRSAVDGDADVLLAPAPSVVSRSLAVAP